MNLFGGFPFPMCAKHPDTRYQYVTPIPGGAGGGVTCPRCRAERETAKLEERAAVRRGEIEQIPIEQASAGAQRTVREAEFDAWCEGRLGAAWHEFLDGFGVAPTEPFPAP